MNLDDFRQGVETGLPFVFFRPPGQTKIHAFLQSDACDAFSNSIDRTDGFVFTSWVEDADAPGVEIRRDGAWVFDDYEELLRCDFRFPQEALADSPAPQPAMDEKNFKNNVLEIVATIRSGSLSKAVLSRTSACSRKDGFRPFALFASLLEFYPNPYVYLLWHPRAGLWIGATPEKLLEWDCNRMETMALAATKPYRERMRPWTEKEYKEFGIVSDFVEAKIRQSPILNMSKSPLGERKSANVVHLKTEFSFQTGDSFDIDRFLRKFHPTPAILGSPREEALSVLKNLEKHRRQYYCGYLGDVEGKRRGELYVNLRCLRVLEKTVEMHVGCGITADSDCEKEWIETEQKRQTLLRFLNAG